MQASDCVINYLNKNKFLLPYLQYVIFCTFTRKNVIFICFSEISFLNYKVGKLFFSSALCLNLYSINIRSCSAAMCIISLVTLFLKNKIYFLK